VRPVHKESQELSASLAREAKLVQPAHKVPLDRLPTVLQVKKESPERKVLMAHLATKVLKVHKVKLVTQVLMAHKATKVLKVHKATEVLKVLKVLKVNMVLKVLKVLKV